MCRRSLVLTWGVDEKHRAFWEEGAHWHSNVGVNGEPWDLDGAVDEACILENRGLRNRGGIASLCGAGSELAM